MTGGWGRSTFAPADLLPMLPAQPGACDVCFQWSDNGPTCKSCTDCLSEMAVSRTPVLPISLAVKRQPLASTLWQYKDSPYGEVRQVAADRLLDLLDGFMPAHEACLARADGGRPFDMVTWVPSSRGRVDHPLPALLGSSTWAGERLVEGLRVFNHHAPAHQAVDDRFSANPAFEGRRVVIVDDTWTRGANAMAAAHAVKKRLASRVAIVVIGRHFDPGYRECAIYASAAEDAGFDQACCVYCDKRPASRLPADSSR